jgi:hypothetical protein
MVARRPQEKVGVDTGVVGSVLCELMIMSHGLAPAPLMGPPPPRWLWLAGPRWLPAPRLRWPRLPVLSAPRLPLSGLRVDSHVSCPPHPIP